MARNSGFRFITDSQPTKKTKRELTKKEKAFRREASRKASAANKRIKRLEQQGLTNTPAYKAWFGSGAEHFSVRGKTQDQVKSEMARIERFLDNATSTVRGAKENLAKIAKEIGTVDNDNKQILNNELAKFFEATSKVEQFLNTSEDIATVLNYRQVWNAVNEVREQYINDKGELEITVSELVEKTGNAIFMKELGDEVEDLGDLWDKLGD